LKEISSTRKIATILLLLFFAGFVIPSISGTNENLFEPSEVIYAAVFIEYHPTYGTSLTKMVLLDFENIEGLPINTSLQAFGENFQKAEYEVIPWGVEGFAARVTTYYDSQIGNYTADNYANVVCEEFLKVFHQTSLATFDRGLSIDNVTGTVNVRIDRGFFQVDLISIENLIKYKPTKGFGQIITQNFLSQFIPGNFSCGLADLTYALHKIHNAFYWSFKIGYSISTTFEDEENVDLNLNELLGNSGPIEPNQRSSKIMIEIQKNATIPNGTYSMSLENISPAYSSKEEDETILITYALTGPIDNVTARIRISKENEGNWNGIITVIIIGAIISAIGIFLFKKKRRRR
jgi:hypothetical protein